MKPLYLEMQAFGPFVEKQTVDFEALSKSGIFLIKGKTGSGKTTIFDAMTFALYGGSSGTAEENKTGRNNFEELRCTLAPEKLDTIVSFTFGVKGRKYRFTRKLTLRRVKLAEVYEACELDEDGNLIPFFNNPRAADLKAKAEEIIGLNREQFRQVVLLPQGQFERFLTASSKEKTEILNKIFDTDSWQKYAQTFFDFAKKKKEALEEEKKAADIALAEEGVDSPEALSEKISSDRQMLADCEAAHKLFDGAAKQKALNGDISLSERFKPLHDLRKRQDELAAQAETVKANQKKYEAAEQAETVRPFIEAQVQAQADYTARSRTLSDLEKQLPTAQKLAEDARIHAEEAERKSPVPQLNERIGVYESKRENYESFGRLERAYQAANQEYETASRACREASEHLQDTQKKAAELLLAYNNAEAAAKDYRTRYFAGIYGELAASLNENEPCPVCGSTNHPHLAVKAPDSVGKDDMEAKEAQATAAKKKWDSAETARMTAEAEKNTKETALREKEAAKTDSKAKSEAARSALIDGIESTAALNKAIENLRNEITAYQAQTKTLQESCDNAQKKLNALNARIETAKTEQTNAEAALQTANAELAQALANGGYADAESAKKQLLAPEKRNQLLTDCTAYQTKCEENRTALAAKEAELSGLTEPDSSQFPQRQSEISEEADRYNQTSTAYRREIDRLMPKYEKLSEMLAHYNANIQRAAADFGFAKKLRGDTGVGIQRYVIAIKFNQIIGEANEMLKKIHGGRYTLFRTDDKGQGNQSGLELKVHDSRSPEKEGRGVGMLSGGEKFLVSLALSIGMSAVAQKSGVQIDALFIDEGFGTLDNNSIADAMEVLECVRKTNSLIGIISHVALLEENIQTQLEAVETDAGNCIRAV